MVWLTDYSRHTRTITLLPHWPKWMRKLLVTHSWVGHHRKEMRGSRRGIRLWGQATAHILALRLGCMPENRKYCFCLLKPDRTHGNRYNIEAQKGACGIRTRAAFPPAVVEPTPSSLQSPNNHPLGYVHPSPRALHVPTPSACSSPRASSSTASSPDPTPSALPPNTFLPTLPSPPISV